MNRFMRQDTMRVICTGDEIPWSRVTGGARSWLRGRFEPLTLERIRSDATADLIVEHLQRVGSRVVVRLEHLSAERIATGYGLEWRGTLDRVEPAEYDANSSALAMDRLVIQPSEVRSLR